MDLENMLEDLGGTLTGVEATTDVVINKVPEEEKTLSVKEQILNRLARFDTLNSELNSSKIKHDELYNKLLELNPELAKELKELDMKQDACDNEMELIKKELLPMFQVAVAEDPDNKTLLCNKVQATYVYPTKKHSFDLKDFMEKESAFYFDNISKFTPYAKISDVSDCIKITIKK